MVRYANISGADESAYPFKELTQAIFSNSADATIPNGSLMAAERNP
jgi:hypothetical protein